jgi:hypothetical protein
MTLPEAKGVLPYTDARPETVVVPVDHPLVPAIAQDGTGLKPLIIVPRLTIERELYFWGYEVTKVIFEYQEHGFITIQLLKNGLTKRYALPGRTARTHELYSLGAFYIGRLHLPFAHFA